MTDIWSSLSENFDFSLPRMSAISIKEDDYDLGFYCPSHDGRIGYNFLDTNLSKYNQDRYTFELCFAALEYPNLCGAPGRSQFIFSEQSYRPGQISHTFRFPNSALAGSEKLSAATEKGLTWDFLLRNTSVGLKDPTGIYSYKKKLYSTFIAYDGFSAERDCDGVISITLSDRHYYIASSHSVKISVFDNELDVYDSAGEAFSENFGKGRVMLIETEVSIENDGEVSLRFGMSHHSREAALKALSVTDADSLLRNKWNKRFLSLPTVGFDGADERERKLYYKSWWVIFLNYCNYPGWGFNVLESLPVYKGIWQWAIPAVEWYSSQDVFHPCEWIKRAMNILLSAQREDGYVTHAAYLHEEVPGSGWMEGGIIQNPQLPGTALRYYNVSGDVDSLKEWYEPLCRYYFFICREFDEKHNNNHLWALHNAYDTGLDTFPAFQAATYGVDGNEPTEFCYGSILSAERYHYEMSMGKISELTGFGDARYWYDEAEKTKKAINDILWDKERHWYGALQADGTLDTRVGVDGLFPLVYNLADEEKLALVKPQFERLIGKYGIRTCAEGEEGFFSDIYWRGPSWPKSCSLAVAIAKKHFPELVDTVFDSVLNSNLAYPNIWECIDAGNGNIARSNIGFYCTPCMSSNVGAGELLGALWIRHGLDMFGTEKSLPLVPMTDYHFGGLRITIAEKDGEFKISVKPAEKRENTVSFALPDGKIKEIHLVCEENA